MEEGASLTVQTKSTKDKDTNNNNNGQTTAISIDRNAIPQETLEGELPRNAIDQLNLLGVSAYSAEEVEKNVLKQVDEAITKQKQEKLLKSIAERTPQRKEIEALKKEIANLEKVVQAEPNSTNLPLDTLKHKLSLKV